MTNKAFTTNHKQVGNKRLNHYLARITNALFPHTFSSSHQIVIEIFLDYVRYLLFPVSLAYFTAFFNCNLTRSVDPVQGASPVISSNVAASFANVI